MDQHKTQWFSLYHSLQHYKYHTYLMCKDEVREHSSIIVDTCMFVRVSPSDKLSYMNVWEHYVWTDRMPCHQLCRLKFAVYFEWDQLSYLYTQIYSDVSMLVLLYFMLMKCEFSLKCELRFNLELCRVLQIP